MHILQLSIVRNFAVLGTIVFFGTAASRCEGQTVQLPTFRSTGVSTTVLVPDRGSAYLGGVNRSSDGQSSFGSPLGGGLPGFGNRGFGNASSAGSVSVSATIIDLNELDRAILAEAARMRGAKFDVLGRPVEYVNGLRPSTPSRRAAQVPTNSFYAANTRARPVTSRTNALASRGVSLYLRLGRQAEADGDLQSAKVFYEMAAER